MRELLAVGLAAGVTWWLSDRVELFHKLWKTIGFSRGQEVPPGGIDPGQGLPVTPQEGGPMPGDPGGIPRGSGGAQDPNQVQSLTSIGLSRAQATQPLNVFRSNGTPVPVPWTQIPPIFLQYDPSTLYINKQYLGYLQQLYEWADAYLTGLESDPLGPTGFPNSWRDRIGGLTAMSRVMFPLYEWAAKRHGDITATIQTLSRTDPAVRDWFQRWQPLTQRVNSRITELGGRLFDLVPSAVRDILIPTWDNYWRQ